MSELDDLELERPEEEHGPARRRPRVLWLAVPPVVAIAAILAYFALKMPTPPGAPESPASAAETERRSGSASPPVDDPSLPSLDQSDALVRELARGLSSHPRLAEWLATRGLIRTFTVVVSNVAEGVSPAKHLPFLAPRDPFRALHRGERLFIDPKSYERYDVLGDAVASLDTEGCARLYRRLHPLSVEAYRELGHPDGDFDRALEQAMRRILETPVLEGEAALIQSAVLYEYADPRLESLTAAQKHFLRIGPRNLRLVNRKLRELAPRIGIRLSGGTYCKRSVGARRPALRLSGRGPTQRLSAPSPGTRAARCPSSCELRSTPCRSAPLLPAPGSGALRASEGSAARRPLH